MRKGRLDGFPHLQYANFLSLSNEESVIVSPIVSVHTLRKKGKIKILSVLPTQLSSLVP